MSTPLWKYCKAKRIFTSLMRSSLSHSERGAVIFHSDPRARANPFQHTANHEPKGAAMGAQTYLKEQAVPLVLGIDGGEAILVLGGDVDLVPRE